MKIDIWSPLPPVPSGIAHYTQQVFSTGFEDFDIQFVDRAGAPFRSDAVPIYQLGNNPYHEFIYLAALDRPGIVEIHDFSVHHLVTEMTLAKGDKTAYEYVLGKAAGERGISLAQKRGQKKPEYHPQLQFEMPLLEPFIRDAYHVIVHSRWARQRTKMIRRDAPVSMIPHFCQTPEESGVSADAREVVRKRLNIADDETMILCAGFVTPPKRIDLVLKALERCQEAGDTKFRLVIAGEVMDPGVLRLIQKFPDQSRISMLGYTDEKQFDELFMAADIVPALRWPSVGESSGVASRAVGFGKRTLAFNLKAFADLPKACTDLISLGSDEEMAAQIAAAFSQQIRGQGRAVDQSALESYLSEEAGLGAVRQQYRQLFEHIADVGQQAVTDMRQTQLSVGRE